MFRGKGEMYQLLIINSFLWSKDKGPRHFNSTFFLHLVNLDTYDECYTQKLSYYYIETSIHLTSSLVPCVVHIISSLKRK